MCQDACNTDLGVHTKTRIRAHGCCRALTNYLGHVRTCETFSGRRLSPHLSTVLHVAAAAQATMAPVTRAAAVVVHPCGAYQGGTLRRSARCTAARTGAIPPAPVPASRRARRGGVHKQPRQPARDPPTAAQACGGVPKKPAEVVAEYNRVKATLVTHRNVLRGLVRLPRLKRADGQFTLGGLMLTFFSAHLGHVVTKAALVGFLRQFKCDSTDPQPRHLGMQRGFDFLVAGCWHPGLERRLRCGEYCLLSLERAHPSAAAMHRSQDVTARGFDALKRVYGHRCACCGSKEGDPHLKNGHLITRLEKGHCDPRRPLANNCLPMCGLCNMVYKDRAVFNPRGFIVRWLAKPCTARQDRAADDDGGREDTTSTCAQRRQRVMIGLRVPPSPPPRIQRLRKSPAAPPPAAGGSRLSAPALNLQQRRRSPRIAALHHAAHGQHGRLRLRLHR